MRIALCVLLATLPAWGAETPLYEFTFDKPPVPAEGGPAELVLKATRGDAVARVMGKLELKKVAGKAAFNTGRTGGWLQIPAPAAPISTYRVEWDSLAPTCDDEFHSIVPIKQGAEWPLQLSVVTNGIVLKSALFKLDESVDPPYECVPGKWRHVSVALTRKRMTVAVDGQGKSIDVEVASLQFAGPLTVGTEVHFDSDPPEHWVANVRISGTLDGPIPARGKSSQRLSVKLDNLKGNADEDLAAAPDKSGFKNDLILFDSRIDRTVKPSCVRIDDGYSKGSLGLSATRTFTSTYELRAWVFTPAGNAPIFELGPRDGMSLKVVFADNHVGVESKQLEKTVWAPGTYGNGEWHYVVLFALGSDLVTPRLYVDDEMTVIPKSLWVDDAAAFHLGGGSVNSDTTYNPCYGQVLVRDQLDVNVTPGTYARERARFPAPKKPIAERPAPGPAPATGASPARAVVVPAKPESPGAPPVPQLPPGDPTALPDEPAEDPEELRAQRRALEDAKLAEEHAAFVAQLEEQQRQFYEGIQAGNDSWAKAHEEAAEAFGAQKQRHDAQTLQKAQADLGRAKADRERAEKRLKAAACVKGDMAFNRFGKMATEVEVDLRHVDAANTKQLWWAERASIAGCITGACLNQWADMTRKSKALARWASQTERSCEGLSAKCGAAPLPFDYPALQVNCTHYDDNSLCLGSVRQLIADEKAAETYNSCAIRFVDWYRAQLQ